MQPLDQLPADRLAAIAGIASDYDDTLTAHGALTVGSLASLHALAAAGVPLVVVTGRPLGWAEVLIRTLPVRAVVTENGGAWLVREGKHVRVAFLQSEAVRAEGMVRVRAMVSTLLEALPTLRPVRDLTLRCTDVALDLHEATHVDDSVVREALSRITDAGLYGIASTVHLHVSARRPDKVEGLEAAVGDLGLASTDVRARWLYVGDSPNDADPFAQMDLSIGVSSVRNFEGRMPAWPKYVTHGGPGEGFVEVAERVLAQRSEPGEG